MHNYLLINIAQQTLQLLATDQSDIDNINKSNLPLASSQLISTYRVSSAKNGIGSLEGSGCTPLGRHTLIQKIGDNRPSNSVFVGRQFTGEIYSDTLGQQYPHRDWILSRILWLSGCEEGLNKGYVKGTEQVCDTYRRYIYIHGTPDSEPMGVPLSHGCIRMRNQDIIELYDRVEEGTPVFIIEK